MPEQDTIRLDTTHHTDLTRETLQLVSRFDFHCELDRLPDEALREIRAVLAKYAPLLERRD